ncbi:MAG: DHHW family protein, partial [Bacilli bacterium]
QMSENIHFTRMDDQFLSTYDAKTLESMYFKTDHHWNSLGANAGFKTMLKSLGAPASVQEQVEVRYKPTKDTPFVGSYALQLYELPTETSDYYRVELKNHKPSFDIRNQLTNESLTYGQVFINEAQENKDTYSNDSLQKLGAVTIHNDNAPINERIVLFKDSYINTLAYAFASVYSDVLIIDQRYFEKGDPAPISVALSAFKPDKTIIAYNSLVLNGPMFDLQTSR